MNTNHTILICYLKHFKPEDLQPSQENIVNMLQRQKEFQISINFKPSRTHLNEKNNVFTNNKILWKTIDVDV